MFVSKISNISSAEPTKFITNPVFCGYKKTSDSFENSQGIKIERTFDKNGDLKTITEFDKDGSVTRKGKMIENCYGTQKLLIEYPKSKNKKKELYVTDNYQRYSYKLSRENTEPGTVYVSNYLMKFYKKITNFPKDKEGELRCDFKFDKNSRKVKDCNVYTNGVPSISISTDRDNKNRMIRKTVISPRNNNVTNIKYLKDKTLYHFENDLFDEKIVTPKGSKDEQHSVTLRKSPLGREVKNEFNYVRDKQLDYTEYDYNDNVILKVIGDPETKDVMSYKQFDENGLIQDEYERKNFFTLVHTEYKNGKTVKKSEEEYAPYNFDKDITVPDEEDSFRGIADSYKIDEIYPVKY